MNVPELSLVIPCHNEEKNLQPLLSVIHATLDPLASDYEIVITDDCSTDNSWSILKQLTTSDPRLCIQRFKFNCGESAASWTGMQMSPVLFDPDWGTYDMAVGERISSARRSFGGEAAVWVWKFSTPWSTHRH